MSVNSLVWQAQPGRVPLVVQQKLRAAVTDFANGSRMGDPWAAAIYAAGSGAAAGVRTRSGSWTAAAADWPTYHGTMDRAGVSTTMPAASGTPQRIQSLKLDGDVYASPIVAGGLTIVATEQDRVCVSYGAQAGDCGDYKGRVVGVPLDAGSDVIYYTPPTKRRRHLEPEWSHR